MSDSLFHLQPPWPTFHTFFSMIASIVSEQKPSAHRSALLPVFNGIISPVTTSDMSRLIFSALVASQQHLPTMLMLQTR